jgi:hypothetical protein
MQPIFNNQGLMRGTLSNGVIAKSERALISAILSRVAVMSRSMNRHSRGGAALALSRPQLIARARALSPDVASNQPKKSRPGCPGTGCDTHLFGGKLVEGNAESRISDRP